jgi:RNA polymerase sigma factor (sigma-70 family)
VPSGHQRPTGEQLTELVGRALADDAAAWRALVDGLERVVWKAVNMMTLDADIREDAFAATWLRLAERLDSIREPHKLPGWLTTTATNEVRMLLRQRNRQPLPASEPVVLRGVAVDDLFESLAGDEGEHSRELVAAERRREVRAAFARLDESCREVLTVLVTADPPVPYDEASARLGRPIGSLGPTRRRCLDKLRQLLARGEGLERDV